MHVPLAFLRLAVAVGLALPAGLSLAACGDDAGATGAPSAAGGASSGAAGAIGKVGGSAGAAGGGGSAGGATPATGGAAGGGSTAGGASVGGAASGGSFGGGAAVGGSASGGAPTGGTSAGGAPAGGSPAGGASPGGAAGSGGGPGGDILPGSDGCSCQRPGLVKGAIPTPTTVGFCGAMKQTFTGSKLEAGKLRIDAAFVKANGGKVVDSIQVDGSIEIEVDGVTLCNFKADALKISAVDVRVQDGTFLSDSSLFVNFGPGSSGLVTRVYAEGGSADAVRVTTTAAGKTQTLSQSYFTEIAKFRDADAHSDLIQTFPVPAQGAYFSALVEQCYFSSALYAGTSSGRAVNATWMSMVDGARFEGNLVDRVFQGFWYQYDNPSISIFDNLFNRDQMDGLKYLGCEVDSNVKHGNNFWFTRVNGQVEKGEAAPTCK